MDPWRSPQRSGTAHSPEQLADLDAGAGPGLGDERRPQSQRAALGHGVDRVHHIGARSKADLQFVTDHRSEVTELRGKVEDLLSRVNDTDHKIAAIDSRHRSVV